MGAHFKYMNVLIVSHFRLPWTMFLSPLVLLVKAIVHKVERSSIASIGKKSDHSITSASKLVVYVSSILRCAFFPIVS